MKAKFRRLNVWNDSLSLAKKVCQFTEFVRSERKFYLSDQMNRAALSIVSNIAEGSDSGSDASFCRYLNIASSSLAEIRAQLDLCKEIGLIDVGTYQTLESKATKIYFRIKALKSSLNTP